MSGSAELPLHTKLAGKCICGHSAEAHGSNGFICCACDCKKFVLVFDPATPKATQSIP
jgi:hypothetical protein